MQVSVDERLGFGEEFLPEARDRSLERSIAAQIRDDFVELRRGMTIARVGDVGIPENQIGRASCRERVLRLV